MSVESALSNTFPISLSAQLLQLNINLMPTSKESSCMDYAILVGTELGYVFTTIVGVIETIFWAAITLLGKAIHVFLPKTYIGDRIIAQLVASTFFSITTTVISAIMIYKNFFISFEDTRNRAESTFREGEKIRKAYFSDLMNYQLFAEQSLNYDSGSDSDND